MLGTLIAGMAFYHPASITARSFFVTTPIVSNVRRKVVEVNIKSNQPLKKGDVLWKIDPIPFQAQVDNITAQLAFAQKRLEESKTLAAASAGSVYDVESFEKEVKSLEAQLISAQFNLDSTVITAPAEGFVTHLRLRPGMVAVPLPLAPVMTFVNTDEPIFVAGFSQQPMQNIKEGNRAEIFFPGIPGRVFQGHVQHILGALAEVSSPRHSTW